MAILRTEEIRDMTEDELEEELKSLESELMRMKATGNPENPGRIREIKRTIARVKTIQNES